MAVVKTGEFKGHQTISIYKNVDEMNKEDGRPIVTIGVKKAEALMECADQIRAWIPKAKTVEPVAVAAADTTRNHMIVADKLPAELKEKALKFI